jgi:hypothetical protein
MRLQETDALVQHDSELQNGSRFSTDFQNTTPPSYFDTWSEPAIQMASASGQRLVFDTNTFFQCNSFSSPAAIATAR